MARRPRRADCGARRSGRGHLPRPATATPPPAGAAAHSRARRTSRRKAPPAMKKSGVRCAAATADATASPARPAEARAGSELRRAAEIRIRIAERGAIGVTQNKRDRGSPSEAPAVEGDRPTIARRRAACRARRRRTARPDCRSARGSAHTRVRRRANAQRRDRGCRRRTRGCRDAQPCHPARPPASATPEAGILRPRRDAGEEARRRARSRVRCRAPSPGKTNRRRPLCLRPAADPLSRSRSETRRQARRAR